MRTDLQERLSYLDLSDIGHDEFVRIVMSIFNKHVPIKLKYIRANDSPFMNRELRKAMMVRSKHHLHILLIKNKGTTALRSSENLRKIIMGVSIPLLFQTIRNSGK